MRMKPNERKQDILAAVMPIARSSGYFSVGWAEAARAAEVSPGTIRNYFGTLAQFHRAIISHAIATCDLIVIAQGLACNDSKAKRAPQDLINAASEMLKR